jgi:hypothetical protein
MVWRRLEKSLGAVGNLFTNGADKGIQDKARLIEGNSDSVAVGHQERKVKITFEVI